MQNKLCLSSNNANNVIVAKILANLNPILPVLHCGLSLLILLSSIVIQFNERLYNYHEISLGLLDFVFKITVLDACLNLFYWIYTKRFTKVIVACIFLVLAYIIQQISAEDVIFNYILVCIAISNLKLRTCLVFSLSLITILIASAFFANLTEIGNETYIGFRDDDYRYSFGQGHPNGLGASLFYLSISLWSLFKSKFSNVVFIILNICLILFLIIYVDSRTAEICLSITTIVIMLSSVIEQKKLKKIQENSKYFLCFCTLLFPVCAFFVLLICSLYDPNNLIFKNINELFSTRLELTHDAFAKYGLNLFGHSGVITYTGDPTGGNAYTTEAYDCLDSIYAFVAIHWGIVGIFLYCVSNYVVIRKSLQSGNYKIALALAIFAIEGISEIHYLSISFNILIFLLFTDFNVKDKNSSEVATCCKENLNTYEDKYLFSIDKVLNFVNCTAISLFDLLRKFVKRILVWSKLLYKVAREIALDNFVESKYKDSEYSKNFNKLYLKAKVVFIAIILLALVIFFENFVDYIKTVFSILDFKDFYSKNILILIFAVVLAIVAILLKTLFFTIFYKLYKSKLNLKYTKHLLPTLIFGLLVSISAVAYCEFTLSKECERRVTDIQVATNIVNATRNAQADISVYVDKVPNLYRRAGIDVDSKTVFFDSVYLDKKANIIFADPEDEHILLFRNGYLFAQLSPTLSMYVKDPTLQKVISDLGIVLTNRYTCKKELNLKRIAYLNQLKSRNGEPYLKGMEQYISKIDPLYLTPGKYRFTINYHYDEEVTWLKYGKVFCVALTSNYGKVLLLYQDVIPDVNVKGQRSHSFEIVLNESRYTVGMSILPTIGNRLYLSKISYEKLE